MTGNETHQGLHLQVSGDRVGLSQVYLKLSCLSDMLSEHSCWALLSLLIPHHIVGTSLISAPPYKIQSPRLSESVESFLAHISWKTDAVICPCLCLCHSLSPCTFYYSCFFISNDHWLEQLQPFLPIHPGNILCIWYQINQLKEQGFCSKISSHELSMVDSSLNCIGRSSFASISNWCVQVIHMYHCP